MYFLCVMNGMIPIVIVSVQNAESGLDEFFWRVSQREGVDLTESTFHARVVVALLSEAVTVGEIEDVRAQLPEDFARLFEVENEGNLPEIDELPESVE